jgi:hypothetical protein
MLSVDEATAATIRQVFEESGELSAEVELPRHFSEIRDNENARMCVRAIAGWRPLPSLPRIGPGHAIRKTDAVTALCQTADAVDKALRTPAAADPNAGARWHTPASLREMVSWPRQRQIGGRCSSRPAIKP